MSHHSFMALLGLQGMWVCLFMCKYRGTVLLSPLPSNTHRIFHSIEPLSPQFAPNLCTKKPNPLYNEPLQDGCLGFCLLLAPYSLLPPPKIASNSHFTPLQNNPELPPHLFSQGQQKQSPCCTHLGMGLTQHLHTHTTDPQNNPMHTPLPPNPTTSGLSSLLPSSPYPIACFYYPKPPPTAQNTLTTFFPAFTAQPLPLTCFN